VRPHTVQNESAAQRLLTRTYTAQELDTIRRTFGQYQSLVQSAVVLAAQVLELHEQGLGPEATVLVPVEPEHDVVVKLVFGAEGNGRRGGAERMHTEAELAVDPRAAALTRLP
jgi:hypothetical protein